MKQLTTPYVGAPATTGTIDTPIAPAVADLALATPAAPNAVDRRRTMNSIHGDFMALEAILIELQGDVSDEEVAAAIDEWLLENQAEFDQKADGYAEFIARVELRSQARKAEADRIAKPLYELSKQDENLAKRLKERCKEFMILRQTLKLETPLHKFAVTNNGGVQPMAIAEGLDIRQIPEELHFVTTVLNEEAIRLRLAPNPVGSSLHCWPNSGTNGKSTLHVVPPGCVMRETIMGGDLIFVDHQKLSEAASAVATYDGPDKAVLEAAFDEEFGGEIQSIEIGRLMPRGTHLRIR